jgi:diguanylate cyclase (GGDEF)-like protein
MGDFSESFNKMVEQLKSRESNIIAQRENMLRVFDQLEPVFIVSESSPDEVLYSNKMAKLRFHLDDDGTEKHKLLQAFREQCQPESSAQIQDADTSRWYRVSCDRFFWDEEMDSLLYHCVDVTAHIKRENDLEHAAHTDKLTGLNNRYVFELSFDKLWDTCRQNKSPLSVIIFDIDFFKKCNDTYGHMQGDKCLVAVAAALRAKIGRFNDVLARFGGEEFVALLPFTNQEAAAAIADTVRAGIENLEIPLIEKYGDLESISITISGGVASCIPSFDAVQEELISAADKALYQAKQTGRNRICVAEI